MSSKIPDCSNRPFAVQFSATPPAIASLRSPRRFPEVPADVQHHFVEAFLQRGRDVAMIVGNFRIRRALRNQMLFEIAPRGAVIFAIVARFVQSQNRNLDRAVGQQLHGLLEKVAVARRIAVRRQVP